MFEKRWTSSIALLLSGTFCSRGIWLMLGVPILLSILGWGDQDLPGGPYTDQGGTLHRGGPLVRCQQCQLERCPV